MSGLPGGLYTATIGGHALDRPDRLCLNLQVMRGRAPRRTEVEVIPGKGGVRAYPTAPDARTESLRMLFIGAVDGTGAPAADPIAGLEDALEDFEANVYGQAVDDRGEVEFVLTSIRTGRSWVGPITMDDFRANRDDESGTETAAILTVTLTAGELAPVVGP